MDGEAMPKIKTLALKDGRAPRSEEFARRLRVARCCAGMSAEQVAAAAGVGRSTLTQWETGRCEPSMGVIEKLAEVLGVSPAYLILGEGNPTAGAAGSAKSLPGRVAPSGQ